MLLSHVASDWINLRGNDTIHESYVTRCKTSLPWVGKKHTTSTTDFVAKSRTAVYFMQQICAICDKLNCCKKGLKVTSKTCN